ncbi:hypothetical protein [Chryseobacterium populi]|uniref:Uncharacterized protein n=1 Tax=Chryseobacterium populi TaxID=1144316 RepID=J3CBJ4_9FLAO|nr:hypothetical protein [Chryseobacterium populi]EJL68141.1 hypothetical protein PMI13_03896 [Chryseobacterium populi]
MVNVTGFHTLRSERINTDDAHFSRHSGKNGITGSPRTVKMVKGKLYGPAPQVMESFKNNV